MNSNNNSEIRPFVEDRLDGKQKSENRTHLCTFVGIDCSKIISHVAQQLLEPFLWNDIRTKSYHKIQFLKNYNMRRFFEKILGNSCTVKQSHLYEATSKSTSSIRKKFNM